MTKKDFELIAEAIQSWGIVDHGTKFTGTVHEIKSSLTWHMAKELRRSNPRFDSEKFTKWAMK